MRISPKCKTDRTRGYLRTGDVLDQLCYRSVVSQRAPCSLHVRQLSHKLLDFPHCFGIVAFLKEQEKESPNWLSCETSPLRNTVATFLSPSASTWVQTVVTERERAHTTQQQQPLIVNISPNNQLVVDYDAKYGCHYKEALYSKTLDASHPRLVSPVLYQTTWEIWSQSDQLILSYGISYI